MAPRKRAKFIELRPPEGLRRMSRPCSGAHYGLFLCALKLDWLKFNYLGINYLGINCLGLNCLGFNYL
jgi:hypothetical protein